MTVAEFLKSKSSANSGTALNFLQNVNARIITDSIKLIAMPPLKVEEKSNKILIQEDEKIYQ